MWFHIFFLSMKGINSIWHKLTSRGHQRSNRRWLHFSKYFLGCLETMYQVSCFYHRMHNWSGFLHESALLLLLLRRCFLWKSPGNFPGKIPPAVIVLPVWSIWAGIVLPTDQSDCSMPPSHVINEHGSQLSLINILTFISNTSHPCYSSCINVSKSCTGPCMKRQQLANSRSSFEKDNLQTKVYLEILNTFHCD